MAAVTLIGIANGAGDVIVAIVACKFKIFLYVYYNTIIFLFFFIILIFFFFKFY